MWNIYARMAPGQGGHYSLTGDITSEYSPPGHYSLVNIVRGDIIHGGTLFTPINEDTTWQEDIEDGLDFF